MHVRWDSGQAEELGQVKGPRDRVDDEGRPGGWDHQDGEGEAQRQEGHCEHELFARESRVEREQLVLRRSRQSIQDEAVDRGTVSE